MRFDNKDECLLFDAYSWNTVFLSNLAMSFMHFLHYFESMKITRLIWSLILPL